MRATPAGRRPIGIALVLLLATAVGAAAAAPTSAAVRRAGVYITGQGRVTGNYTASGSGRTAFARTRTGTEHLLVSRDVPGHFAGTNRLVYLTRPHGKKKWIARRVPGSLRNSPAEVLDPVPSLDGRRLLYFVYREHALQYADVTSDANRLPALRTAPASLRGQSVDSRRPLFVVGGVGMPHQQFALLVDDCSGSTCSTQIWNYAHHRFTRGATLPRPSGLDLTFGSIARDSSTGELAVFASGRPVDGPPQSPFGVWVWTKQPGRPWSAAVEIAPPTSTDSYYGESLTAARGRVTVGIVARRIVGDGPSVPDYVRNDGEYVAQQTAAGWALHRIPRTDAEDGPPLIVAGRRSGLIHLVFATTHGIVHQTLSRTGTWSARHQVSPSDLDVPLAATLTARGKLVLAYSYRPAQD